MKIISDSTARLYTWHYIEELKVLIDCGDGVVRELKEKITGLKHIFLTHSDRDHNSSLRRVLELCSRTCTPNIYYPADCPDAIKLKEFIQSFDDNPIEDKYWIPVKNKDEFTIRKDVIVKCHTNNHIITDTSENLSFGFKFYQVRNKLKSEFVGLSGSELGQLRNANVNITSEVRVGLFGFSGDCMLNHTDWCDVESLVHECTFINKSDDPTNKHRHTFVEDLTRLSQTNIKHLVLTHVSTRYKNDEFHNAVSALDLPFKVTFVFPHTTTNYSI
jgi:ribonuclease Z